MASRTLITPSRTTTFTNPLNNLRIDKTDVKDGWFGKKKGSLFRILIDHSHYASGGGGETTHTLYSSYVLAEAEDVYSDLLVQLGFEPRDQTGRLERIMKNIPATLVSTNKDDRRLAELLRKFKRGDFDVHVQNDNRDVAEKEYEEPPFNFEKGK